MMFEQVKVILEQYTDGAEITEQSTLMADLGLTSFDVVDIIAAFEDTFGIEIADRDISKFGCVKDILEYLKRHM